MLYLLLLYLPCLACPCWPKDPHWLARGARTLDVQRRSPTGADGRAPIYARNFQWRVRLESRSGAVLDGNISDCFSTMCKHCPLRGPPRMHIQRAPHLPRNIKQAICRLTHLRTVLNFAQCFIRRFSRHTDPQSLLIHAPGGADPALTGLTLREGLLHAMPPPTPTAREESLSTPTLWLCFLPSRHYPLSPPGMLGWESAFQLGKP